MTLSILSSTCPVDGNLHVPMLNVQLTLCLWVVSHQEKARPFPEETGVLREVTSSGIEEWCWFVFHVLASKRCLRHAFRSEISPEVSEIKVDRRRSEHERWQTGSSQRPQAAS